jgi:hypothetical protein
MMSRSAVSREPQLGIKERRAEAWQGAPLRGYLHFGLRASTWPVHEGSVAGALRAEPGQQVVVIPQPGASPKNLTEDGGRGRRARMPHPAVWYRVRGGSHLATCETDTAAAVDHDAHRDGTGLVHQTKFLPFCKPRHANVDPSQAIVFNTLATPSMRSSTCSFVGSRALL